MRNIILCGFKSSGKTTAGRLLAEWLGCAFYDTDALLENRVGKSCRELYVEVGEQKFRELECAAVRGLNTVQNSVIACGGGTLEGTESVELLQSCGDLIYLDVSYEVLMERVPPRFRDLYAERHARALQCVDLVVQIGRERPEEVVEKIWQAIGLENSFV